MAALQCRNSLGRNSLGPNSLGPGGTPPFVRSRYPVVREGELRPRAGVVRRLTGVGAATEAEDVIQERLECLRREEVGDERVVVIAVVDCLGLGHLELRQAGHRLPMLSLFFCRISLTALSFSSAGARSASLSATRPLNCFGQRGGVGQQVHDGVPALLEHTEQVVGVEDQSVDLCTALGQDLGDPRSAAE